MAVVLRKMNVQKTGSGPNGRNGPVAPKHAVLVDIQKQDSVEVQDNVQMIVRKMVSVLVIQKHVNVHSCHPVFIN